MIGRQACLLADRHHRPIDCKPHDVFEGNHPAVDDRQAGRDATRLDMFAVIAAEAGTASEVQNEPAAAHREMASLGLESACDVIP